MFYQKLCRNHKPALEKQRTSKLHTDSGPPSPTPVLVRSKLGTKNHYPNGTLPKTPPHKKTNHSQSPKTTNLKKANKGAHVKIGVHPTVQSSHFSEPRIFLKQRLAQLGQKSQALSPLFPWENGQGKIPLGWGTPK